jgi:hypothetical protein
MVDAGRPQRANVKNERFVQKIVSALLFLPVVYQYEWLSRMFFEGQGASCAESDLFRCAVVVLCSVTLSSISIILTWTCVEVLAANRGESRIRGLSFRVSVYVALMIFLIVSHGGDMKLMVCGLAGAILLMSIVLVLVEVANDGSPLREYTHQLVAMFFAIALMLEWVRSVGTEVQGCG